MLEDEASQFLKHWCLSWGMFIAQAVQNLFRTPMCRSFPVSLPNMIAAPEFALYEWLCDLLLHPPSTITVMAGTPSWKDPRSLANRFSSFPASNMDSVSFSFQHCRISRSMLMKFAFVITGTPNMLIVSSRWLCMPTTSRYLSPHCCPICYDSWGPFTLDELSMQCESVLTDGTLSCYDGCQPVPSLPTQNNRSSTTRRVEC